MMKTLVAFLLVASIIAATSHGADEEPYQIFPLRLKPGSGSEGATVQGITCASWRLAVEAHNIIEWKTVPAECENYVGNYMLGQHYRDDSKAVNREAYFYARSLALPKDGRNIWIFDIDETTLSNLPYYAQNGFGVQPSNSTKFYEWVDKGEAPALPETQKLYNKLLNLGIKIVFLTGRDDTHTEVTASNLKKVGYHTWHKLILKNTTEYGRSTAVVYKSAEREKLVKSGYRIVGNTGDQWSDILGSYTGRRTFKLPDPLYYLS
ncbi:stem 28 kDa glycoprotein-like [Neltuma alba]|uniref:stem 28 kDa glycoprotein-like n=1 Tax=Neltuma alba TaxID=207710 RepID=UPI0010A39231|nr:stem 28 kDa glycoprotein-like [Prosopis alba]